jgi:hypothetical protein
MDCNTCERRSKINPKKCDVFLSKPKNCWAWTDDPNWLKKVRKEVKEYTKRK